MAFVRVWVHLVWRTKNRHPYLVDNIKQKVVNHIKENAKQKKIFIDCINGYNEHLHGLFCLNAEMSISKAVQLIKGESAFWINKEKITKGKFEWADEYFAVSVSESQLEKVRAYINKQEEHHKETTFTEEYEKIIKIYKFKSQG